MFSGPQDRKSQSRGGGGEGEADLIMDSKNERWITRKCVSLSLKQFLLFFWVVNERLMICSGKPHLCC
jgi:hypothetical protein